MNPLRWLTEYIYKHYLKPDLDEFADAVVKHVRSNESRLITYVKETDLLLARVQNDIIKLETHTHE